MTSRARAFPTTSLVYIRPACKCVNDGSIDGAPGLGCSVPAPCDALALSRCWRNKSSPRWSAWRNRSELSKSVLLCLTYSVEFSFPRLRRTPLNFGSNHWFLDQIAPILGSSTCTQRNTKPTHACCWVKHSSKSANHKHEYQSYTSRKIYRS